MNRPTTAFTLAEVVICVAIVALVFGGIITAYTQAARRAEWTGYSLAAQALAIQQLEQTRSAVWDPSLGKNEVTNLNLSSWTYTYNYMNSVLTGYTVATLDLPISGTNIVQATNFVTWRMFFENNFSNTPVRICIVRVDTVWPFIWGGATRYYTNTVATYMGPDNRDVSSL